MIIYQGYHSEEIHAIMKSTREKTRQKYQSQLTEKPPELSDREEKMKQKLMVDLPLSYSKLEYSKLISWILDKKID